MVSQTKFAVVITTPEGQRVRLMPRSSKTTFFTSEQAATKALDKYSRKLSSNGFRGHCYATPYDQDNSTPVWSMAL